MPVEPTSRYEQGLQPMSAAHADTPVTPEIRPSPEKVGIGNLLFFPRTPQGITFAGAYIVAIALHTLHYVTGK